MVPPGERQRPVEVMGARQNQKADKHYFPPGIMEAASRSIESAQDDVEARGSWGEKQIARMLGRYGIRYEYERPIIVLDHGKVRIRYPDFWLPEYAVAVEYCGLTGDADYDQGIVRKKQLYETNGIDCIFLDKGIFREYWPSRILVGIQDFLEARRTRFEALKDRSRSPGRGKSRE